MVYRNLKRLEGSSPVSGIGKAERSDFILGIHSAHNQLKEHHVDVGGTSRDATELRGYTIIIATDCEYALGDDTPSCLFVSSFLCETGGAYRNPGEIYGKKNRQK